MRALVVDDEKPARDELIYMLNSINDFKLIEETDDGQKAIKLITDNNYDVVFLDIQMPSINGLEVAKYLIDNLDELPYIIFVTAYDKYAVDAFRINAVDYLLKPFSEERLREAVQRINPKNVPLEETIDKIVSQITDDQVKKIPVNSKKGRIRLLDVESIIVAYTEDNKTYLKSTEGDYEINLSLKELENLLERENFFRCHRSYLVNLCYIKEVIPWFKGKYHIILDTEEEMEIPVGRTRIEEFKKQFNL